MTEDDKGSPESEAASKGTPFKGKEKREKSRPLTKIVCRRLPPSMNEEAFLEQVSPIPEHDYFYFSKPDFSLTPDLFSRAYINFVNVDDIFIFRDKFDDYIFLDEKGNEFPAVVEYAPFQRLPKKRRKKDPKSGTIESDTTYLEFLETLKETDSDSREPKMEYSYQPTEEKKETTTPLLEFLAAKRREERRRREDRQRRRPRNRKDDEIIEEYLKKVKTTNEKEKTFTKKKDDDSSSIKNESGNVDYKDTKYVKGGNKSYREQRKSVEDQRKKTEYEKKDYAKGKDPESPGAEEKGSRRDRKDRQRDQPRDKIKEVKKYSDSRRDKLKSSEKRSDKLPSFRPIDEFEQDDLINASVDAKVSLKNSIIVPTSESSKPKCTTKVSLLSSNIKPFTQLPQYKAEDLTKVIEELDKSVNKSKMLNDSTQSTVSEDIIPTTETKTIESKDNKKTTQNISKVLTEESTSNAMDGKKEKPCLKLEKADKIEIFKVDEGLSSVNDSSEALQQRRSSLESSEKKSPTDEVTTLRRHKSLDDKSQDMNDDDAKTSSDKNKASAARAERRIRNKDRPSIAIYQPGMGRFSKQRLEREKDVPAGGTYKSTDPNIGSSKDKLSEE